MGRAGKSSEVLFVGLGLGSNCNGGCPAYESAIATSDDNDAVDPHDDPHDDSSSRLDCSGLDCCGLAGPGLAGSEPDS